MAAQHGHEDVMRALIDGGADVNIQFNGWAAIAFATEFANDNEGGTCCLWARSALSIRPLDSRG
jgi:ankyrin repeat protein